MATRSPAAAMTKPCASGASGEVAVVAQVVCPQDDEGECGAISMSRVPKVTEGSGVGLRGSGEAGGRRAVRFRSVGDQCPQPRPRQVAFEAGGLEYRQPDFNVLGV